MQRPRVYLAGPEVFLPRHEALRVAADKKAICSHHGLEGVFPFDLEPEAADLAAAGHATAIALKDERLVRTCAAVLANVTPFRGASADVGTVYEVGYARGLGKPVFGYSNEARPYLHRCGPLSADGCDADGLHVEQFGCCDNLMVHGAFCSGGDGCGAEVAVEEAVPVAPADRIARLPAFRAAAARVAAHLAAERRRAIARRTAGAAGMAVAALVVMAVVGRGRRGR